MEKLGMMLFAASYVYVALKNKELDILIALLVLIAGVAMIVVK